MRVRSSSAPTVRRRPNHRALSIASAAGSANPLSSSTSRSVKWPGSGCSMRHQPDHRAAGEQCGVDAGVHAGSETGAAARQQVQLRDRALLLDCECERGRQLGGSRTAAAAGCPRAGP